MSKYYVETVIAFRIKTGRFPKIQSRCKWNWKTGEWSLIGVNYEQS